MKKLVPKITFTLVLFLSFSLYSFAQKTVSGVVTDAENNEPLIGASVIVNGATTTGTVTDFEEMS